MSGNSHFAAKNPGRGKAAARGQVFDGLVGYQMQRTSQLSFFPSTSAVTVAVPLSTAVTVPSSATVTTLVLSELHFAVPLAPVTWSCLVAPWPVSYTHLRAHET